MGLVHSRGMGEKPTYQLCGRRGGRSGAEFRGKQAPASSKGIRAISPHNHGRGTGRRPAPSCDPELARTLTKEQTQALETRSPPCDLQNT